MGVTFTGAIGLGGVLAAVASCTAAWIGVLNRKKIAEVHVLVNDRLDKALAKIDCLQKELQKKVDSK
jgi:hypothetical protein